MKPYLLVVLSACVSTLDPAADPGTEPSYGPDWVPPSAERLCKVEATCGGTILDEPKAPCQMTVSDAAGAVLYDGPAGFEIRGRSSLTFPKPQYAVELHDYNELPVWPGSTWRYLDQGVPADGWTAPTFDDSAWTEGRAPLGYTAPYLQTELTPGTGAADASVTRWFRKSFEIHDRSRVTQVEVGVMRNDGVAIYLNGVEILRDNLDPDATADQLAQRAIGAEEAITWLEKDLDSSILVDGSNVLAVEVHQGDLDSNDLRFDLYLEAGGDDADVDLFGMGAAADWVLDGMYVDRGLVRNSLAFDLFQSFGGVDRYAPESVYCELDLNGEYQGVYTLGERIQRDNARVDISRGDAPGETFIIKLDDAKGFHPNQVGYGTWQLVYPKDDDALDEVSSHLDGWEESVSSEADMFKFLDLDSTVDWVLLEELMKNADAYQLSVHLWRDEGGKMHFAPWDFDLSLGYPYTNCSAEGWLTRAPYVDALAASPVFHEALVSRWAALRDGPLREDVVLARLAAHEETLAPAAARNFDRWPIEDIAFGFGEVDNWLCPVASYADEQDRVRSFLAARLAWMDANINEF